VGGHGLDSDIKKRHTHCCLIVCLFATHTPPILHTGDARQQHEASLAAELQALSAAVDATPRDVVTRPGEGLGVPSPGFKALGRMELLVSTHGAVCVGSRGCRWTRKAKAEWLGCGCALTGVQGTGAHGAAGEHLWCSVCVGGGWGWGWRGWAGGGREGGRWGEWSCW
jgi:hypothetical protein